MLAGGARVGIPTMINNLIGSVAPGGWLQVTEMDTQEGTLGPAAQDLMLIMRSMFAKIGMGENFGPELDKVFKEAGLQNVEAKKLAIPAGKLMGNEQDCADSIEPFKITIPSLTVACQSKFLNLLEQ